MVAVRSCTGESIASILGETAEGKAEFGLVRNHSDWFGLVPNFLFKKEFDREWKSKVSADIFWPGSHQKPPKATKSHRFLFLSKMVS